MTDFATAFLPRAGRRGAGGTTDADLRIALRFVFHRPGWAVEEWTTAAGGDTYLGVVTPGRGRGRYAWRILRSGDRLTVLDLASGAPLPAEFPTMRDALTALWEAVVEMRGEPVTD